MQDSRTNTAPEQTELPLPFPELSGDLPLLPARMVNELAYCSRLAYLECVQGEWANSSDTVEGRHVQRRVDKPGGELPDPEEAEPEEKIQATFSCSVIILARLAKQKEVHEAIKADGGSD